MNEKEIISEMAKCYCDYCMAQTGEKECENQADKSCSVFWDCEFFYKAGYRKIPEGAVVLTREENEKWLDFLELNIKKARKEAAREIYIKACDYSSEMGKDRATQFSLFIHWLSKQFCLEVE